MSKKVLELKPSEYWSKINVVNSYAQSVLGMAHCVDVEIGDWVGNLNLMVVPLDGFDVIIGNDFFRDAKMVLMPHLGGLLVTDERQPRLVASSGKAKPKRDEKQEMLSAVQVKDDLRKGEITYLAALIKIKTN